jgi:hypothetical protein
MTQFLDLRLWPVGGELATSVAVHQTPSPAPPLGGNSVDPTTALKNYIQGQHVLIGTHGFNVNRADGISCLSNWGQMLRLPPSSVFVGLLWPGDSIWLHGADYPEELSVADQAGMLLGPFLDTNFASAASISFASHSLGVRVILSAVAHMKRKVSQLIIMAGAIDDSCLTGEFKSAANSVDKISVLASREDKVLKDLFPIGNFFGELLEPHHPWFQSALGRSGPSDPTGTAQFVAPYQIPNGWMFDHGDYIGVAPTPNPRLALSVNVPGNGSPIPDPDRNPDGTPVAGFKEDFSSSFTSSRLI